MAHRPHRSADQWQSLIERQSRSSQSAIEFCRRHDLGYASFMQWRIRLAKNSSVSMTESQPAEVVPHFVELTGGDDMPETYGDNGSGVEQHALLIELDLGGGVQLRVSRGG